MQILIQQVWGEARDSAQLLSSRVKWCRWAGDHSGAAQCTLESAEELSHPEAWAHPQRFWSNWHRMEPGL